MDLCIPGGWRRFEIVYRYRRARYDIAVHNPLGVNRGVAAMELDGEPVTDARICLQDDARTHHVYVVLG